MGRWTPLLLKAITFLLAVGIVVTGIAITRYALFDNKLKAPRTEIERTLFLAVQAVKANPNDPEARVKLAAVYLEMGRVNEAVKEATTATKLAPDDADAFYILGVANREKGNMVQAAQNLEKAAKKEGNLAPFYQVCWTELASVYMEQKKFKQAIKAYDKALGYGPENASILYELARAYELSRDMKNAEAYYKEVLEYLPDHEDALKSLARLEKEKASAKNKSTSPAAKTEGSN